jgi:hypothetical protein
MTENQLTEDQIVRKLDELLPKVKKAEGQLDEWRFQVGDLLLQADAKGFHINTRELAERHGFVYRTLQDWKNVSSKWPSDKRNTQVSWSIHRALRNDPDRFERINDPNGRSVYTAQAIIDENNNTTKNVEQRLRNNMTRASSAVNRALGDISRLDIMQGGLTTGQRRLVLTKLAELDDGLDELRGLLASRKRVTLPT